jgi:hypothetical protein
MMQGDVSSGAGGRFKLDYTTFGKIHDERRLSFLLVDNP